MAVPVRSAEESVKGSACVKTGLKVKSPAAWLPWETLFQRTRR